MQYKRTPNLREEWTLISLYKSDLQYLLKMDYEGGLADRLHYILQKHRYPNSPEEWGG